MGAERGLLSKNAKKPNRFMAALLAATTLFFSGCGAYASFDHEAYVRSLLDASYKAEFAEYSEITGSEESAAEKQYSDNITLVVNAICDSLSVDISEEYRARLRSVVEKTFNSALYEVEGSDENAGGDYKVKLKISPIMNFSDMEIAFYDFANLLSDKLNAPELEGASVETVNEMFIKGVVDLFEQKTNEIIYGDEQILSIPVIFNMETQKWYIPDENLKTIFDTIVSM